MYTIEFLNALREWEMGVLSAHLRRGAKILEIGGGTGTQAKLLAEMGHDVTSVDVAASNYREHQVFPIIEYDGITLPFDGDSFDVVYSSNVLEHVADLDTAHRETRRVLRSGGYCLHVLPTRAWRFWTSLAHCVETWDLMASDLAGCIRANISPRRWPRMCIALPLTLLQWARRMVPPRHGERGTVFSELYSFDKSHWLPHFRRHGFNVIEYGPMGLFYTGHSLLGARWPLEKRNRLAPFLGSAGYYYKLKPGGLGVRG